jgi:hypothetical protein
MSNNYIVFNSFIIVLDVINCNHTIMILYLLRTDYVNGTKYFVTIPICLLFSSIN